MYTRLLAMAPLAAAALLIAAGSAGAYNLFGPYPWGTEKTYYLKWGDIFRPASPGGTITWSLMPDGTTIAPAFTDPNISGVSSLGSLMNGLGHDDALAAIQRGFERWSAAANIYFTQVPDSGLPFHHADANPPHTGHIRIGAFPISGNVGAVGYGPPPNGGPLEGDVLFNANSRFQFAAGEEGEEINFYVGDGAFHNDFEGLFLHELGHALGLAHSDVCSAMSIDFDCYKYINRIPDADDVAGVQFLYGPALAADFNMDNLVAAADLADWTTGFGTAAGATRLDGDATADGQVDGGDFLLWQREFGRGESMAPASAVPEPGCLGLAIACLAIGGDYRRRRGERHIGLAAS